MNPTAADQRGFTFLKMNDLPPKPRARGVTEIRGPYYTLMGKRYLQDVLETMGAYVDALKFAGGSFSLMPTGAVRELIELCHKSEVLVSTGGFIEYVLTQGREAVGQYIRECKELGFDIIEVSSGFITLPGDDWLRLVQQVHKAGLKAKPEVGIQFGAGGAIRHPRAGIRGVTGLLRRLPQRAPARKPDPSAARLFRGSHLPAGGHPRRFPHPVGGLSRQGSSSGGASRLAHGPASMAPESAAISRQPRWPCWP